MLCEFFRLFVSQKCSRDASAYVRRCAAHAVLKLHSLDPIQHGPPMEVRFPSGFFCRSITVSHRLAVFKCFKNLKEAFVG